MINGSNNELSLLVNKVLFSVHKEPDGLLDSMWERHQGGADDEHSHWPDSLAKSCSHEWYCPEMCNEGYQEAKHSDEHPKLDLRQRVNSNHLGTVLCLPRGWMWSSWRVWSTPSRRLWSWPLSWSWWPDLRYKLNIEPDILTPCLPSMEQSKTWPSSVLEISWNASARDWRCPWASLSSLKLVPDRMSLMEANGLIWIPELVLMVFILVDTAVLFSLMNLQNSTEEWYVICTVDYGI